MANKMSLFIRPLSIPVHLRPLSMRTMSSSVNKPASILVGGGLVKDIICRPAEESGTLLMGSSMPGHVSHSFGGVARNIAETIGRLEISSGNSSNLPNLAAVVGGHRLENSGDWPTALNHCQEVYINPFNLLESKSDFPTPTYAAMLNEKGGLVAAIADFRAIDHFKLSDGGNDKFKDTVMSTKTMVLDANFSVETLSEISDILACAPDTDRIVWWEPTSVAKCTKYLRSSIHTKVTHVSPNLAELFAMNHAYTVRELNSNRDACETSCASASTSMIQYFEEKVEKALRDQDLDKLCDLLEMSIKRVARGHRGQSKTNVILTLGEFGVIVAEHLEEGSLCAHWLPAACLSTELSGPLCVGKDGRTNVTGAGDTMVGTALWWLNNPSNGSIGSSLLSAIYGGTLTAAVAVLEVDAAVPPSLSQPEACEYIKSRVMNEVKNKAKLLPFGNR